MDNKLVQNRRSPRNEDQYIEAYKELNRRGNIKNDGLDIAAVRSKDGTLGHALLSEELNRCKDSDFHRAQDFIPDSILRQKIKSGS
jgi:hypothetical protein